MNLRFDSCSCWFANAILVPNRTGTHMASPYKIQSLGKPFDTISHIWNIVLTWILGRILGYLTRSFHFSDFKTVSLKRLWFDMAWQLKPAIEWDRVWYEDLCVALCAGGVDESLRVCNNRFIIIYSKYLKFLWKHPSLPVDVLQNILSFSPQFENVNRCFFPADTPQKGHRISVDCVGHLSEAFLSALSWDSR